LKHTLDEWAFVDSFKSCFREEVFRKMTFRKQPQKKKQTALPFADRTKSDLLVEIRDLRRHITRNEKKNTLSRLAAVAKRQLFLLLTP
jgi:hypothetical protein